MIVHDVEQGTPEWHKLRAGIPTASEFSQLVTRYGQPSKSVPEYAMSLAAERYAGEAILDFGGNRSTDRGKKLEPEADADYSFTNQVEVEHVGFITDNLMRYGCSPDGLVGKDGGVEYKCKTKKEHLKVLYRWARTQETPTEYYAQPQGCMFITGRKWWDLVFYHPQLPGLTIRQYPDRDFVRELKKQLKAVEIERNLIVDQLNDFYGSK